MTSAKAAGNALGDSGGGATGALDSSPGAPSILTPQALGDTHGGLRREGGEGGGGGRGGGSLWGSFAGPTPPGHIYMHTHGAPQVVLGFERDSDSEDRKRLTQQVSSCERVSECACVCFPLPICACVSVCARMRYHLLHCPQPLIPPHINTHTHSLSLSLSLSLSHTHTHTHTNTHTHPLSARQRHTSEEKQVSVSGIVDKG
jgi:hypothetical protein